MPVMDGTTATKKIIEKYGEGWVPIVAMTANAYREDKDKCFDAGMIGFIAKPIKQEDLKKSLIKFSKTSPGIKK